MKFRIHIATLTSLAWAPAALLAQVAPAPKFAAPEVASSLPSGTAGGIGQVSFALFIVLLAVFGLALLARRLRQIGGGGPQGIEVLAQTSLGGKERAVIVRVGDTRLLLGVAGGQVSLLHTLPPGSAVPAPPPAAVSRPGLGDMVRRSLGR